MSRYSGKCGKGARRAARVQKREEAEARNIASSWECRRAARRLAAKDATR